MKIVFGLLFFVFSCLAQESGEGTIEGVVHSKETKESIIGATVFLEGTVLGTTTNNDGRFIFNHIPVGTYTVTVTMIGFERKVISGTQVQTNQTATITLDLDSKPVETQPVIITAGKREQLLQDIPAAVSIVDDKQLSLRNSVSVDDALRYVPGVNFIQSQINIRGSTGYSKGIGTRVLLLVDGLPMLSGDTGEIIWESLPTNNIERIEIVKGAGSALYGSSALGGVVNVITKTPTEQAQTHISLYGGFYDTPYYDQWDWAGEVRYLSG